MCVHGSQAVFCTTELRPSVDKKEEKNKERTMLVFRGYILSTVETGNTCIFGRQFAILMFTFAIDFSMLETIC